MAINLDARDAASRPARPGPAGAAPRRSTGPAGRRHGRAVLPWLYLAPALLLLGVFRFWPTIWGIYLSFFNVRPYLGNQWIGLANFRQAFDDPALRSAVGHTLVDAVASVAGSVVLGFCLALLLEGPARHLRMLRTAVFLPVVVSMVAAAELWNDLLFPAGYGGANSVVGLLGLGPYPYLSSPHSALASVIGIQIWKSAPYDMMIFVAGLAGIDTELYEAAAIDGAGGWQRFRYVTLPLLQPIILIVTLFSVIFTFADFQLVYVLTHGGPQNATHLFATYAFDIAMGAGQLGMGASIALTMLPALALLIVAISLYLRRKNA